jgi:RND family efflux transporter MFP subunit
MDRAGETPGPTVSLTPEMVRRAQIEVGAAEASVMGASLRLPGVIEPDAYRSVAVTPLVAGRVTEVLSELGDRVAPGASMARVYSPELAQAQAALLASRAALAAHDQQLRRTERLIEIGAASQQELEHIHAEHTAMSTRVETARATLELLGLSSAQVAQVIDTGEISAVVDVPAPLGGIVTERRANVGLNVDPTMALFTVIDLSTVWAIADLYERDFAAVRIGSQASVTTTAYPGFRADGRVSYIDPQVQQDTRTARVRVEVPNADGRLRLGMYVDVSVQGGSGAVAVVVPVDAVQPVGDQYVVYVPGASEGTFVERQVHVGPRSGDRVAVETGLRAGEPVVTAGAFFLRAERERVSPVAHEH